MFGTSLQRLRVLALSALITGGIYHVWLFLVIDSWVGLVYFFLEIALFLLVVLFVINHWQRRYVLNGGVYSLRPIVDIYIPIKNESVAILKKTLAAAREIEYPNKRIYILDDSARRSVQRLAQTTEVGYIVRPDRAKRQFKAANLNYALQQTFGMYVLVLDVDQVPQVNILDDTLGHFKDPNIALVTTRQRFAVVEDDFNHDHLFYEYMQAGKNHDYTAISCGSGVVYRRSALDAIGGFAEWNLVEDLYTSYLLHSHGYRSVYVNQSYTRGIAPQDLRTIYKQRGTWATDTLRLFFWKMPFFNFQLSWRQRLHYFELGYIYVVSAIVLPAVFLLNFYSLFNNAPLAPAGVLFVIAKVVSFYCILKMYNELGQGNASSMMWAALFPVYFRSLLQALLYKKPQYSVTKKQLRPTTSVDHGLWKLALPHLVFVFVSGAAVGYYMIVYGVTPMLGINIFWLAVMMYWFTPIFSRAFPE